MNQDDLLTKVQELTGTELSDFVQITSDLLKASTKAMASIGHLDYFLYVAQDANSKDLLDFIHLVDQLDETQKPGFLFTAQKNNTP